MTSIKPPSTCAAARRACRCFLAAFVVALAPALRAQIGFVGNGQQLNNAVGNAVTVGDFNGDSFLDAWVSNSDGARVYIGDGQGRFTDSGQSYSGGGPVADVDGDGDLDLLAGTTLWRNDGQGRFTAVTGAVESAEGGGLACQLADVDGDGFPDVFAIRNYGAMRVYLNDGTGHFRDSGQRLGDGTIGAGQLAFAVLGDLDGNGTADAVTCGWRWDGSIPCPNRVWLNDGQGNFHDSGQLLDEGASHVHGLAMGDLNGDGRPDLVMGIQDAVRSGRIYLNDGTGRLVRGSNLTSAGGEALTLADFDGNGSLDIFAGTSSSFGARVWLNDGTGAVRDSGLDFTPAYWNWGVAAGDFNSDGKPDVFVVSSQRTNTLAAAPAQIWLNTTPFPPRIRTQPSDHATRVGESVDFSVAVSGDAPLTFRWQRRAAGGTTWEDVSEGGTFTGVSTATLTVQAGAVAQSGDAFRCLVSNGVNPDATSQPAALTVSKGLAIVTIGATSVTYDGSPKPVDVVTSPAGLATTVTYAGAATPPSSAGCYVVAATVDDLNYAGSAGATLAISPVVALGQNGAVASVVCGTVSFDATATGGAQSTWQWQVQHAGGEWTDIAGATAETFTLPSVQAFHAGSYRVMATLGGASAASDVVSLSVAPATTSDDSRLLNLSTRALCLTGNDVLIPGFVVQGTGTKRLLLRAAGAELGPMGVFGFLPDPRIVLRRLGENDVLASNDDWSVQADGAATTAEIAAAAASVWAFPLSEGSTSAALLVDLPAGNYTLVSSGADGETGVAIVEAYEIEDGNNAARLVNLSNRGYVGEGDSIMIPGFIVSHAGARTFLVRAVGPTLGAAPFNVPDTLADPVLRIFDNEGACILTSDTWGEYGDGDDVRATAAALWAFPLLEGSADAAFVVTLPPGAYTVQTSGVDGSTGVALVEVYLVQG